MTALEVLDSAVKIGLGALIAGASTYLIGRAQFGRELRKERIAREFEMLKQTAEQVELFTHSALKYWAHMVEWSRYKRDGQAIPDARVAVLEAGTAELFAAFKEMTSAEAKLLLLGLKEAQLRTRNYGELITIFRKEVNRDKTPLGDKDAQEWRSRILAARESLFDELGKCYQGLGP